AAVAPRLPGARARWPCATPATRRQAQDARAPGRRTPPLGDRGAGPARVGPGQLDASRGGRPLGPHPRPAHQPRRRPTPLPPPRPPSRSAHVSLAPRPRSQATAGPRGPGRAHQGAATAELVWLSQDEARLPLVPTLARTLGVTGHRPEVGTRDQKG